MRTRVCNLPIHRPGNRADKALVLLKGSNAWPQSALRTKMDFQATVDNEGAAEHQKNERVYNYREE